MVHLVDLAASYPSLPLPAGHTLIEQGLEGGDIFILDEGSLRVERDGVRIATIANRGALIGEMAVVLGTPSTATVKAETACKVHVIRNARDVLQSDPALTFQVAWMIAQRLDSTSAYLVKLSKEHADRPESGLLGRILAALHAPTESTDYVSVGRSDLFDGGSSS